MAKSAVKQHDVFLVFSTLSLFILAKPTFAGTPIGDVVLVAGPVTTKPGKIVFTEWLPGQFLKTNPFSQYRGSEFQSSSKIDSPKGSSSQPLRQRGTIDTGSVIETGTEGYTRLLLKDDSIIDLGPHTSFSVEKFEVAESARNIVLKLLKGKIRVLVTRKLQGRSTYQVSTPGIMTWVRGTDFIVHTIHPEIGKEGRVTSTVLGVRGQVTCDLLRHVHKGEVYFQPFVVKTYSMLTATSADGFVFTTDLKEAMSRSEYSRQFDEHSPFTDPNASILGMHPGADILPGTGVLRSNRPGERVKSEEDKISSALTAELEAEHPPVDNTRGTISHNFNAPREWEREPSLVNYRMGGLIRGLGPDATDRLPYEALRTAAPTIVPIR